MDYENKIDIPFGAKDSELKGWEYTIPEGMEAIIKDGKVIVREKDSEDERIRKIIYKLMLGMREEIFTSQDETVTKDKVLAYIEKQKVNTDGDFARGYDCGYEICLNSHGAEWFEKQKEQKTCGAVNVESDYDKGFRDGHRFGLKQTQEYMLSGGKTFSGLIPCWVNAPSELQPAHKYHGKNVVIMHENNGGFRCVCIDDEKAITFLLPEDTFFVEGWRKNTASGDSEKPNNQWCEEDSDVICEICEIIDHCIAIPYIGGTLRLSDEHKNELKTFLKSLRSRPKVSDNWKPSEEQMNYLCAVVSEAKRKHEASVSGYTPARILESLYNDLKKL